MVIKDSGLIDTRLYDNSILLAKILYELDGKLTEEEKEIIKFKFLKTYEKMPDAADTLEAANKRIVNLLTALHLANEKLAYVDCQPYTEIDGEEMISDWVKTLVYEELHTQIQEEGEMTHE